MSAYQVAVVEDEAAPTSGAAIIRIEGLTAWPQGATVRLVPIDDAAVPPLSEGWPWGELIPSRVVPTGSGIDVILGPDVVSSPRLVPGTPITIKVSAAQLEADARWPAIAPTARRRTGAVAMSATQLLAAKAERERAEKDAAARRQELAEAAARSVREAAASDAVTRIMPAAKVAAGAPGAGETSQLARLLPLRRPAAPQIDPLPAASDKGQLTRLTPQDSKAVVTVASPGAFAARPSRSAWRGFAAGLATMGLLATGLAFFMPAGAGRGAVSAAVAGIAGEQIPVASLDRLFKDVANTAVMSPRNKSAVNVDAATALSLADHSLRGTRSLVEMEEAEFWLKRAISANVGGAEVGWALTQLGTIYAQSDYPQHNYSKAQALWQLAAAQGDPVAHCFLGALYEHGLGVPSNRRLARDHYLAADAANACKSSKDAAARLKD
jgi:Sel1 repeat